MSVPQTPDYDAAARALFGPKARFVRVDGRRRGMNGFSLMDGGWDLVAPYSRDRAQNEIVRGCGVTKHAALCYALWRRGDL